MKIFLCWSGERSRRVAEAFNAWFHSMFPGIETFFSEDIEKGAKWDETLSRELADTSFGIACLTPDNLESTWIHYEVGKLSKLEDDALIWTFLLGVQYSQIKAPLNKFQHTTASHDDVLKLVRSINKRRGSAAWQDRQLDRQFRLNWPALKRRLDEALDGGPDDTPRDSSRVRPRRGSRVRREKAEPSGTTDGHRTMPVPPAKEADASTTVPEQEPLTIINAAVWDGVYLKLDPVQPQVRRFVELVSQKLPGVTDTGPAHGQPSGVYLRLPRTPSRSFAEAVREALSGAGLEDAAWSGIPAPEGRTRRR